MERVKRSLSNLKLKRLVACYTQQQVADAAGITREYYNALENGRAQITGNVLVNLAVIYGCKQIDLI